MKVTKTALLATATASFVLLGESSITGKMSPTAHAPFTSIAEAERFGAQNFKVSKWCVAKETADGYQQVTPIRRPKANIADFLA